MYVCNDQNNVPSRLLPQWLWATHAPGHMKQGSLITGGYNVFMITYIYIYIMPILPYYALCVSWINYYNTKAEISQLVSAMECPQERRLFINIYRCLEI